MSMTKDMQIEEKTFTDVDILANDINQHCADLAETFCGDTNCLTCLAHALTKKGYRKVSKFAREIGEEIQKMAEEYGGGVLFWNKMQKFAAELEKKCVEDEK